MLIGSNGKKLGEISLSKALEFKAESLDLVQVSPADAVLFANY